MSLSTRIDLWIRKLHFSFIVNNDYDCSNDKPMFICELSYNFIIKFGIEILKVYNDNHNWNGIGIYNPYFKKWQIKLTIGKFIKIFNNAIINKL
uniref:Uncharacterized protein n=1 Tax=viral metagenome TaxID=1070528 RepID=A0A6H1ZDA4_9ZZZZ